MCVYDICRTFKQQMGMHAQQLWMTDNNYVCMCVSVQAAGVLIKPLYTHTYTLTVNTMLTISLLLATLHSSYDSQLTTIITSPSSAKHNKLLH